MSELSLVEIRNFMVANGGKVTNHALVKHFKAALTNPDTQSEDRKQFKTFVNMLATIRNEDGERYLVLRPKYVSELPSEEAVSSPYPESPSRSQASFSTSEAVESPHRQPMNDTPRLPPPYRPPPEPVHSPAKAPLPFLEAQTETHYRDCVGEYQTVLNALKPASRQSSVEDKPPIPPPKPGLSRETSLEQKLENDNKENENTISVKEAAQKFNQLSSQEEAKVISPMGKMKKNEERSDDKNHHDDHDAAALIQHPKAKEWLVVAAKSDYQRLSKLASEHPILVKLKTALHWAAKHGNGDIVKLIAGTYKADVNERTGYTALHIANQFGRNDILELLTNVYKANRDLRDFSGKKPHDYQKQMKKLSSTTYSKIKARKKHSEKDLGFLRIGSLNARVKKTTEAFSNFMGVSNKQPRYGGHHHHPRHHRMGQASMRVTAGMRNSAPPLQSNLHVDNLHKSWGSADNIPNDSNTMPPPKYAAKKRRGKRDIEIMGLNLPHSTPTTPSTTRSSIGILDEQPDAESLADSDSDGACGFDSNWSNWATNNSDPQSPASPSRPTYI